MLNQHTLSANSRATAQVTLAPRQRCGSRDASTATCERQFAQSACLTVPKMSRHQLLVGTVVPTVRPGLAESRGLGEACCQNQKPCAARASQRRQPSLTSQSSKRPLHHENQPRFKDGTRSSSLRSRGGRYGGVGPGAFLHAIRFERQPPQEASLPGSYGDNNGAMSVVSTTCSTIT